MYHICLSPGDSDCARLLAGMKGMEGDCAGGAAGVVLAGREDWHFSSLSPHCLDRVSGYVDLVLRISKLLQLGSQCHLTPSWEVD